MSRIPFHRRHENRVANRAFKFGVGGSFLDWLFQGGNEVSYGPFADKNFRAAAVVCFRIAGDI